MDAAVCYVKPNQTNHNTRPSVRTFSSSKKSLSADSSAELPSACFGLVLAGR